MTDKINFLDKANTGKWLLALSVIVSLFWVLGNSINVYSSAGAGAIFEILWLPMLACILIIPVLSIMIVVRKNAVKLLPILSIIILAASLLYLTFFK